MEDEDVLADADAEVLVVAVLFVEDVIVTEGTSVCSVKWNTKKIIKSIILYKYNTKQTAVKCKQTINSWLLFKEKYV